MGTARPLRAHLLNSVELPERYLVLGHVASGGMASVWSAEDVLLGRRVAIKLLDERFQHEETAVARFKREARTAAKLSAHRNVVTIYDVGEIDGRAFIVMEYLPGGTVATRLRLGPVPRAEILRWLRDAADALDYAHRSGVVHRDIKPGNLLLDRDGVLHIGDFGIARLLSEATITATGQLFGTAAYLAPEQALGQPASAASDRYALCVAAFELLTGERPFAAEHFAAQAGQHIEDAPPRASERNNLLPRALDPVLAKGMDKDPAERWPTAGALVDELEHALTEGVPAPARTTRLPRPATPPRGANLAADGGRRRRAAVIAALAAVALAAGALAAVANHGSSPTHPRAEHLAKPAAPHAAAHARPRPVTRSTPTTTGAPQTASTGASAAALEARGHQLMVDGSYAQALGVLQRAVSAADPGTLTYAYALYDLGHTLRVSGNPRAAIPILERRLQIPNQLGVVRHELALAERAAGAPAAKSGGASGGAPLAPGDHRRHNRGRHGGRGGQ